jgi:creatinine amidohydrolase
MKAGNATGIVVALLVVAAWTPVLLASHEARKATRPVARHGVVLADLTWVEAEKVLGPETVVVIPIGAASKEHGPHLKLKNDWLLAQYFAARVVTVSDVVVAPTVGFHYYPAFTEYPGSTSLRLETARDALVDVCRGLARFRPRRFYVLNTGISTIAALKPAAQILAGEGILLEYTDLGAALDTAAKGLLAQEAGTHADEAETSMMLFIDPSSVDMTKAVKDIHPRLPGGSLTRDADAGRGLYSPSGVYGDATLATREKGEKLVEALVAALLRDIEKTRTDPLPAR